MPMEKIYICEGGHDVEFQPEEELSPSRRGTRPSQSSPTPARARQVGKFWDPFTEDYFDRVQGIIDKKTEEADFTGFLPGAQ